MSPLTHIAIFAAACAAPMPALAQDAAAASAPAEASAFVHVEAEPSARLRKRGGRFGKLVCEAPCDRTITFRPGASFTLEGTFDGLPDFELRPGHDNLIRVEGNPGLSGFGFGSTLLGGALVLVSGVVFGLEAALADAYGNEVPVEHMHLYGGLAAGGAGLLALGIPLLVAFMPRVSIESGPVTVSLGQSLTVGF